MAGGGERRCGGGKTECLRQSYVANRCGRQGSTEGIAGGGGVNCFHRHGFCREIASGVRTYGTTLSQCDDDSLKAPSVKLRCGVRGSRRSRHGQAGELCRF